ncbi:DnaB-like helicase N-terminal domain-containing protein [Nostoc sp. 'Peltigera membranacea cyanobiont' N6]|uniref:DnaB-like helicase N-terminal domain-containing protein n=1 Tax=Nostoc sp. 'Peltigera membranacea cyanobiont' N6 TaxID=1261031 RepID=UPI0021585194|nr:DnaB-like helicase N-terminal domain-containing protein [Nostoc sp. 'Peltigera membranacea cyanobiont' N6]
MLSALKIAEKPYFYCASPNQNRVWDNLVISAISTLPQYCRRQGSQVSDRLSIEAFYISAHKDIYQAAAQLHATYQPTDLLSVTAWLA